MLLPPSPYNPATHSLQILTPCIYKQLPVLSLSLCDHYSLLSAFLQVPSQHCQSLLGPGSFTLAVQVTSCAPLFVEVKPDAGYSAICSGDAAVCKGFQTSVSNGDLHLELSNTPQSNTPTSVLVMLPAAQLSKVNRLHALACAHFHHAAGSPA